MNENGKSAMLADQKAAMAVEEHHSQMASALATMSDRLTAAARDRDQERADEARRELVSWCQGQLVPHAVAEERTMYSAAADMVEARMLIESMVAEHQAIIRVVNDLSYTEDALDAAGLGRALRALFDVHLPRRTTRSCRCWLRPPTCRCPTCWAGCTSCSVSTRRRKHQQADQGHFGPFPIRRPPGRRSGPASAAFAVMHSNWAHGAGVPSGGEGCIMIILGVVLIIIGWLAGISILITIGVILAVIGLVLTLLGAAGRGIGGRTTYY